MFSIPADPDLIQADDPQAVTQCLHLPGLHVTHLVFSHAEPWVLLHVRATAPSALCPTCGHPSTAVHQYHRRLVRDLAWADHRCCLQLVRRRFKCADCQRPFTEELAAVAPHARTTRRYATHLVAACRSAAIQTVARQEAHGYKAVEACFYTQAARLHPTSPPAHRIKRLGIDEIAARKGHGHFKLVLVDLDRHQVIEQLVDRRKETLRTYLLSWSAEQRAAVEEVATDFWAAYHEVAAAVLPQARVVGDRFHAQKHINEAVNTTRRAVQRRMGPVDREFVRERRSLFLRNEADLCRAEEWDLLLMKEYSPPLGEVHTRKEEFRTIYNTAPDRATAAQQLDDWLAAVAASTVAALVKAGEFVTRWRESILNYFVAHTSSGMVEGLNNKIKLLKRQAFGFGNDSHFRLRVLMACEGRPLAH